MLEKRDFYINGEWVAPRAGTDFDVIDPSIEEVCAVISLGGQADTDAAVGLGLDALYSAIPPELTAARGVLATATRARSVAN